MFSSLGLFQNLSCPDKENCTRPQCLFSHRTDLMVPLSLNIPFEEPKASSSTAPRPTAAVPAKRPATLLPIHTAGPSKVNSGERPRKIQRLGATTKRATDESISYTSAGVPILKVNAAQSTVAVPVRQAMVKNLYDHFIVLYDNILPTNPTIASEHALRQESEVYAKTNKITYRNAIINSISNLKRRSIPDSISHDSVGTVDEVSAREESRKSIQALRLTRERVSELTMSVEDMKKWGYIIDIPEGIGGDKPNEVGCPMKCERCSQPYMVKPKNEAEQCMYHFGKMVSQKINGERVRIYTCCSRPTSEGGGCIRGPHVFYEKDPVALHSRHAFSHTRSPRPGADSALDVAAMDCEMVYTTGGMRCARVSVVDGAGAEVFDELVRMDDGVEIIDYITRFSGISEENHAKAMLPLVSIRRSLDAFINADTILIGHALDNDLNTLRMIHHRCVDTAILFPHPAGPPYRRALKALVKEHLGTMIQTGDASVGHSSVEDAAATLDLVRWYTLNKSKVAKSAPPPTGLATNKRSSF